MYASLIPMHASTTWVIQFRSNYHSKSSSHRHHHPHSCIIYAPYSTPISLSHSPATSCQPFLLFSTSPNTSNLVGPTHWKAANLKAHAGPPSSIALLLSLFPFLLTQWCHSPTPYNQHAEKKIKIAEKSNLCTRMQNARKPKRRYANLFLF